MYDTLMTTWNHVYATIFPEGEAPIRVSGKVAWFRAAESPEGSYIFGMKIDEPSEDPQDGKSAGKHRVEDRSCK